MRTRRTLRRPISAQRPEARAGFTLVETAVALAVAALFCGAIAVAVADLIRADELALRRREAVLWHETAFTRHALGLDPLADPPPVPGWTATRDTVEAGSEKDTLRATCFRFSPESRPSLVETLYLIESAPQSR